MIFATFEFMVIKKPDESQYLSDEQREDYRVRLLQKVNALSLISAMEGVRLILEKRLESNNKVLDFIGEIRGDIAVLDNAFTEGKDVIGSESESMAKLRLLYDKSLQMIFFTLRHMMLEKYEGSNWQKLEDFYRDKIRWGVVGGEKNFIPFEEEGDAGNIAMLPDDNAGDFGIPKRYSGSQIFISPKKKPLIILGAIPLSTFWAGFMMLRGIYFLYEMNINPEVFVGGKFNKRLDVSSVILRWKMVNDYTDGKYNDAQNRLMKKENIRDEKDLIAFLASANGAKQLRKLGRMMKGEEPECPEEINYRMAYLRYMFILNFIAGKNKDLQGEELADVLMQRMAYYMDLLNSARNELRE